MSLNSEYQSKNKVDMQDVQLVEVLQICSHEQYRRLLWTGFFRLQGDLYFVLRNEERSAGERPAAAGTALGSLRCPDLHHQRNLIDAMSVSICISSSLESSLW